MPRNSADYEEDFYAWTVEQARLLRSGELSAIDAANTPRRSKAWAEATGANSKAD
jgi:Domain of unknown function DUF29